MKKILVLSLTLVMISFAASAQVRPGARFQKRPLASRQFTMGERMEVRKDAMRLQMTKRRAGRDGVVTPMERRRIRHARCETRRDAFRFKHNGRRRVI